MLKFIKTLWCNNKLCIKLNKLICKILKFNNNNKILIEVLIVIKTKIAHPKKLMLVGKIIVNRILIETDLILNNNREWCQKIKVHIINKIKIIFY